MKAKTINGSKAKKICKKEYKYTLDNPAIKKRLLHEEKHLKMPAFTPMMVGNDITAHKTEKIREMYDNLTETLMNELTGLVLNMSPAALLLLNEYCHEENEKNKKDLKNAHWYEEEDKLNDLLQIMARRTLRMKAAMLLMEKKKDKAEVKPAAKVA